MKINKPELVSPAGDWASLRAAVGSGADSVYFGIKGLNMRYQASNFDLGELKKIIKFLHENKKRGYLALNIIVSMKELGRVQKVLVEAKEAGVDAVILWDMAVLSLASKLGLRIHLSTQASVANLEALKFFTKCGVRRIVLARECTLDDIREMASYIRRHDISCEIEIFIHGAMCLSISGRCFLSAYSFQKSANRGKCQQPCRREYLIKAVDENLEYIIGRDYVLSPKDLCTVEFIDELIDAGVHAFKIEGRMRPAEYTKITTKVYRQAIDAYSRRQLTKSLTREFKRELRTVFNRGFSPGFYFGPPTADISRGLEHTRIKILLGEVKKFYKKIFVAEVLLSNGDLKDGDELLFIGKKTGAQKVLVREMQIHHKAILEAKKGNAVGVKVPFLVRSRDKVFLLKEKEKRGI